MTLDQVRAHYPRLAFRMVDLLIATGSTDIDSVHAAMKQDLTSGKLQCLGKGAWQEGEQAEWFRVDPLF